MRRSGAGSWTRRTAEPADGAGRPCSADHAAGLALASAGASWSATSRSEQVVHIGDFYAYWEKPRARMSMMPFEAGPRGLRGVSRTAGQALGLTIPPEVTAQVTDWVR